MITDKYLILSATDVFAVAVEPAHGKSLRRRGGGTDKCRLDSVQIRRHGLYLPEKHMTARWVMIDTASSQPIIGRITQSRPRQWKVERLRRWLLLRPWISMWPCTLECDRWLQTPGSRTYVLEESAICSYSSDSSARSLHQPMMGREE